MSTVKSTYDDPALAGGPIARDRTRELLGQVMGLVAISIDAGRLAKAADGDTLGTGETYVGYGRGVGRVASPAELALNHRALSGDWSVEEESAALSAAGGPITFRARVRLRLRLMSRLVAAPQVAL